MKQCTPLSEVAAASDVALLRYQDSETTDVGPLGGPVARPSNRRAVKPLPLLDGAVKLLKKLIRRNHRRLSAVIGSAFSADHGLVKDVRRDSLKLYETRGDWLNRITVRKASLVISLMR